MEELFPPPTTTQCHNFETNHRNLNFTHQENFCQSLLSLWVKAYERLKDFGA